MTMRAVVCDRVQERLQLGDGAEEHGPEDLERGDPRRYAVEGDAVDLGQLGNAVDEEQAREHEADLHGERDIEHDGDDEGGHEHRAYGIEYLRSSRNACQSPMLNATMMSTAESAADRHETWRAALRSGRWRAA
jgi:hypothetical protein